MWWYGGDIVQSVSWGHSGCLARLLPLFLPALTYLAFLSLELRKDDSFYI